MRTARQLLVAVKRASRCRGPRGRRSARQPGPCPIRVLVLVPNYPYQPGEPNHTFLEAEVKALNDLEELRITLACEHEIAPRPQMDIVRLTRPMTYLKRLEMAAWLLAREPKLLLKMFVDRRTAQPVAWRAWACARAIRATRPDVVHSHFFYPNGTAAHKEARRRHAKAVVTAHGVDVAKDDALEYGYRLDEGYAARLRKALCSIDLCQTATTDMAALVVHLGADPTRVRVNPNAIRLSQFMRPQHLSDEGLSAQLELRRGTRIALSVGNLIELKGFELGIEALRSLPDYHYVIVGSGPEERRLTQRAKELGVSDRVHMVGSFPNDELPAFYWGADVFWFLSRREAFGNVALEAAAAGLPIIGAPCGVIPDLSSKLPNCLVLTERCPDELATLTNLAMCAATPDLDLRRALAPYDTTSRVARTVSTYHDLVNPDGGRGLEPR